MKQLLINVILSYLGSLSFAIIINVPHRLLNAAGITGIFGWLVYLACRDLHLGIFMSNLMGAMIIGMVSYVFARYKKVPILNFNVPGLICLAPGALTYEGVHDTVFKGVSQGLDIVVRVMIVILALAVGTMLSQLIDEALKRIWQKIWT
ncbi:threonine/serine exporter family protein [Xylocopilactobacillus apicola]|uniref:Membrane protein n=1 Tax=Xylocopilactobacillus apicola TaxID=2932184 RepID=A0AAU9DBD9_9LACO|nr:threonine/serine exporter family protein [Xylocopilactobacillus apicola]BDR58112.1 membrane protein [Xylocopilactobacillus apicola]